MKSLLWLLAVSIFFMACGGPPDSIEDMIKTGNVEQLRAKKKELDQQFNQLEAQLALLDSAIDANTENRNIPLVTTYNVIPGEFNHYIELQGDVETRKNVLIYPEVSGTLIKVNVIEGDQVRKGDLLAIIDDGGMANQLLQLKTQLELAKTTYERRKRVWEQNIGSEIQFLEAKANYEAQKNMVEQMERQLSKYSIRAPFDGVVDNVIKDEGTVVAPSGPGSEIFRIVNLSNMYINVDVPESYLSTVTAGKKVEVIFPVLNESINSYVRQTGNFINPDNRSFTAEIPVPNKTGNIKPNLTAKVRINDYSNENAIMIPQSVISENAQGEQYAYLAVNVNSENIGISQRNIIKTGRTQGELVEVLEGIPSGAQIIKEGARSVKNGQEVKILN